MASTDNSRREWNLAGEPGRVVRDPRHALHQPFLLFWALLIGAMAIAGPALAQTLVKTGSYTGNGVNHRNIVIGFEPDFLIIKAESAYPAEGRVSTMEHNKSRPFNGGGSGMNGSGIHAFNPDGFHLGNGNNTNRSGEVYHWTAFDADATDMVIGSYVGTGVDDERIGGFGLDPEWVIIFAKDRADPVHYSSLMPYNESYNFDWDWPLSDRIKSLVVDGMILSDHNDVNRNGDDYYYVAWRESSSIQIGAYNGDDTYGRIFNTGTTPQHVFIQGSEARSPVHRPTSLVGNQTLSFREQPIYVDGIISMDPAGFTLGDKARVNEVGSRYYYTSVGPPVAVPLSVDLSVKFSIDDVRPSVGDTVSVQLVAENQGPDDASAIEILNSIPSGMEWVETVGGDGSYAEATGLWSLPGLTAGATATIDLLVRVDEGAVGQTLTTTVSLQSSVPADLSPGNNDSSLDVYARGCDLQVTKRVDSTTPSEGDTLIYEVAVYNAGPDSAFTVYVADPLPAGVTLVSAEFDLGGPFSGGWAIPVLLLDELATATFTVTVDPGTAGTSILNTATASVADPLDIDTSNNSDSVAIDVQLVDILVRKWVDDANPAEGDTISFGISVGNLGPDPATGVVVSDLLPTELEFVSQAAEFGDYTEADGLWPLGGIAVGDSVKLVVEARVRSGVPDVIVNTASLSYVDQTDAAAGNDSDSATITISRPDASLVKSVDNNNPNVGEVVKFLVTLNNDWDRTALGLEVTDELPDGLAYVSHLVGSGTYDPVLGIWRLGALGPNASEELEISAEVDLGTGGQTIINRASLSAGDVNGTRSDTAVVVVQSADLSISISATPEDIAPGETTTLLVAIPNQGPNHATNVSADVSIPGGLQFLSDTPSVGSYDPDTGIWTVSTIAALSVAQLEIVCEATSGSLGQVLRVTADVSAVDQEDPSTNDLSDFVDVTVPGADLVLTKTVDNITPTTDDPATFSIVVQNDGPNTATSIVVEDILPSGLVYETASATQGGYSSGSGLWTLGTLNPGETATLSITVTLAGGATGNITNTARILSFLPLDPDLSNNLDSATVGSSIADLSVSVWVDDTTPYVGDEITLVITAENDGPETAPNVKILDLLDSGFTVITSGASQGSYDAASGVWTIGTLPSGGEESLSLRLGVGAELGGSTILNGASIYQPVLPDPDTSDDDDDVEIVVTALVDVSLDSSAGPSPTRVGDSVVRTFVISNDGPSPATNVAVQISTSSGLSYDSHSSTGGSYTPATGEWSIGTLAAGASFELALTATVLSSAANTTIDESAEVTAVSEFDDGAANNDTEVSIDVTSQLSAAASQSGDVLLPGADAIQVFQLTIENPSAFAETLATLSLFDDSSGEGSETEIAANWTPVQLEVDGATLTASPEDGRLEWADIDYVLPAGGSLELTVSLGAKLNARDGDVFDVLADASSLLFTRLVPYETSWPLDPAGSFPVDGLVAGQVSVVSAEGGVFEPGIVDIPAADFLLTRNGYEDDVLESIRLRASGSAEPGVDLAAIKIWLDGGDDLLDFGLGDDTLLGVASAIPFAGVGGESSTDWLLDGLSLAVSATPLRVYASVDLADDASPGHSFSLLLPMDPVSIEMGTGNDGPTDLDVPLSGVFSITTSGVPELTVTVVPTENPVLHPGGDAAELLAFRVANGSDVDVPLESLVFDDVSIGTGTVAQMDLSWTALSLRLTEVAAPLAGDVSSSVVDGRLQFLSLPWSVPSGGSLEFVLEGGASLVAADADYLALQITDPSSIVFSVPTSLIGSWPLHNEPGLEVDGMTVSQIEIDDVLSTILEPGTLETIVFRFRVPPDGYKDDTLEEVRLVNLGDATEADIDRVQVWQAVPGATRAFHDDSMAALGESRPGTLLGDAVFADGVWSVTGLEETVTNDGLWIEVTADLHPNATPGATVQFALPSTPVPGLGMASANDGPQNAVAANDDALIVGSGRDVLEISGTGAILATLTPGGEPSEILRTEWVNQSAEAETLLALTFASGQFGPGTEAQLASNWASFELELVGEDNPVVAMGRFEGGQIHFEDLGWILPAGDVRRTVLFASATLSARDSDFLDPSLEPGGIELAHDIELRADWPIDPPGWFEVDGLVAAQLSLQPIDTGELSAGSDRNLALHLRVPSNGYTSDVLRGLNLNLLGTAESSDLGRVELWADDGDLVFDEDTDLRLGSLQDTGNRWEITGLSEPVPTEGIDLFTTVDISPLALESRTLQLEVPAERTAITMESGNDGPWDAALANRVPQVISSPDRVTLSAVPIAAGTVNPGERVSILRMTGTNTYETNRTLSELTLRNRTFGSGDVDQLDAEIEVVGVIEDTNGDGQLQIGSDRLLGSGSFENGAVTIRNLQWLLSPHVSQDLFVVIEVSSLFARDGDVLALELREPIDVGFTEESALISVWPLSSGPGWTVEGMVADQIGTRSTAARTLGPGQSDAVVFDFTLPANGYEDDVLLGVKVDNRGTAGPNDIAALRLWSDGGDGAFSTESDIDLGTFFWTGSNWQSPGLSTPLQEGTNRFFVSLDVEESLADSATVRLEIPIGGVEVLSGNDGPLDREVTAPTGALLSTAPLLVTILTDPGASNVDQYFAVHMRVENQTDEDIEEIVPEIGVIAASADFEWVDGPTPSSLILGPGEIGEFVWNGRGTAPGAIQFVGRTTGRAVANGAERSSLNSQSEQHDVYVRASDLQLFALTSFPVSLNYGQVGVVPFSLTFKNPGAENSSDIELREIQVRLEDEFGADVAPIDLIERVIVNEGTRIYHVDADTDIQSDGSVLTLALDTTVRISSLEPTTLNLRFDLKETSPVQNYRVVIPESSWFEAVDATSETPVDISLQNNSFPVVSGLARLVSEAVAVEVISTTSDPVRVSPAQESADLWTFELLNRGDGNSSSEVRVGSFALTLREMDGAPVSRVADVFDALWLDSPLQTVAQTELREVSGDSLAVLLTRPLSLPVDASVPLTLRGRLSETAALGTYRFELEDEGSFDIRDANTGGLVPARYEPDELFGGAIHVQSPAQQLVASGNPVLPDALAIGQESVLTIEGSIEHPGDALTAGITMRSWTVQLWDDDRSELPIGKYIDRLWLTWNGEEVGSVSPTSDRPDVVLETDLHLEGGQSGVFGLWADVEADAPAGPIELFVVAEGFDAVDANSNTKVIPINEDGNESDLFSGVSTLRLPARELIVELEPNLPATLVADGNEVSVGTLHLIQPDEGVGPIEIEHLVLRTASGSGSLFPVSHVAETIRVYRDGVLWAEEVPTLIDSHISLEGADFFIAGGTTEDLDLRVVFRGARQAEQVKFGIFSEGVGVVQPSGSANEVELRAKSGETFPLWTETGNFSPTDLASSYANFPNPFAAGREETTFAFYLESGATTTLRIWTTHGEEVRTLVEDETLPSGLHQNLRWDGRNGRGDAVLSGVYLAELDVHLESGERSRIWRKVAVVR